MSIVTAKQALWKSKSKSNLQIFDLPKVGNEYLIEFDGSDTTIGDVINVEYLPPAAHYNGFETVNDLDGFRMCSGVIKRIDPNRPTDGQPPEYASEAIFEIITVRALSYFEKQPAETPDELQFWSYFDDRYFYGLMNLDRYALLSWASDSYAGANCIIQRKNEDLFLIRCNEWVDVSSRMFCGRITVPSWLADKLKIRLAALEYRGHWSGYSI